MSPTTKNIDPSPLIFQWVLGPGVGRALSDLAKYTGKLVLGGPSECPTRPFCEAGLKRVYGINFTGFKALDPGGPLTRAAIKRGDVQIGLVFSSDAALASS